MVHRPSKKILPHLDKRASRFDDERPKSAPEQTRSRLRRGLALAALCVALFAIYPLIQRQPHVRPQRNGLNQVTACDRLAADPLDSQRTAPGVPAAELDIEKAGRACAEALRLHPEDGRALYQAARIAFAASAIPAGIDGLRRSATAGYAQGAFALGQRLIAGNGVPASICEGGQMLMQAARHRHLSARISLAEDWRDGRFRDCQLEITEPEVRALLMAAKDLAATPEDRAALETGRRAWGP